MLHLHYVRRRCARSCCACYPDDGRIRYAIVLCPCGIWRRTGADEYALSAHCGMLTRITISSAGILHHGSRRGEPHVLPRDLVDALCPLRAASASPLVIGLIVSMFAFCTRIVEALTLAMGLGPDASSGENRPRSPTAMASRSPKRWNSPPVAGHLQIAEKQAPGAKRAQVEPRSRRREHGWADKAGLGKMQRSPQDALHGYCGEQNGVCRKRVAGVPGPTPTPSAPVRGTSCSKSVDGSPMHHTTRPGSLRRSVRVGT